MKARGRVAIAPGFRHSVALWRLLRRRWCCFITTAKNAHRPVKREKGATPSGGSPFYVMRKNMALAKHPTVLRQMAR